MGKLGQLQSRMHQAVALCMQCCGEQSLDVIMECDALDCRHAIFAWFVHPPCSPLLPLQHVCFDKGTFDMNRRLNHARARLKMACDDMAALEPMLAASDAAAALEW
jgi:hypothetical protein